MVLVQYRIVPLPEVARSSAMRVNFFARFVVFVERRVSQEFVVLRKGIVSRLTSHSSSPSALTGDTLLVVKRNIDNGRG